MHSISVSQAPAPANAESTVCFKKAKKVLCPCSSLKAGYTTPFGLLAMEVLLDLRSAGANFALYTISSRHVGRRRSFRLIQETDIELAWNLAKCDYRYQCLYSVDTLHRVYFTAGTRCTEEGIQRKRQMPEIFRSQRRTW